MTVPIAIAAEAPAKAAEQKDDKYDEEDRSKRHGGYYLAKTGSLSAMPTGQKAANSLTAPLLLSLSGHRRRLRVLAFQPLCRAPRARIGVLLLRFSHEYTLPVECRVLSCAWTCSLSVSNALQRHSLRLPRGKCCADLTVRGRRRDRCATAPLTFNAAGFHLRCPVWRSAPLCAPQSCRRGGRA